MRIVRGALPEADRDRAVTRRLADHVETTGDPILRVWTPPRQVAFGRRDAAEEGYDRARDLAREHGYEPFERAVGGRAVAYTGSTVAFAYGVATGGERDGIRTRYRGVTGLLKRALRSVAVDVRRGEPRGAFCPGAHSLQNGGKIVGIAQRVRAGSALVGGCVVVSGSDEDAIAEVLEPVYGALGVAFDPTAVGSVEGAGGPGAADTVIEAIEAAFLEGIDREGGDREGGAPELLTAREQLE